MKNITGRRISVPLHFCANLRAQESLEWCGCTLPEETRTAQSSKRRKCRPTAMALHRSGGQGQERIGFYILGTLVQQELPLSLWFLLLWFDSSLFLQGFDSSLCGFRQEDRAAAWATSRNLEDGMAGVNWGIETPKVLQEGRMCPGQCCHSLCPSQHPSQSSELASTLSWVAQGGLHSPFLGKLQLFPERHLFFPNQDTFPFVRCILSHPQQAWGKKVQIQFSLHICVAYVSYVSHHVCSEMSAQ